MIDRKPWQTWGSRFIIYTVLAGVGFLMIFPFTYMMATSIKTRTDVFHFPPRLLPYSQESETLVTANITVDVDGETRTLDYTDEQRTFGFFAPIDALDLTDFAATDDLTRIPLEDANPTGEEVIVAVTSGGLQSSIEEITPEQRDSLLAARDLAPDASGLLLANYDLYTQGGEATQDLILVNSQTLNVFADPANPNARIYSAADELDDVLLLDNTFNAANLELIEEDVEFGNFTTPDLVSHTEFSQSEIVARLPLGDVIRAEERIYFLIDGETVSIVDQARFEAVELTQASSNVEVTTLPLYELEIDGETQTLPLIFQQDLNRFVAADDPETFEFAAVTVTEAPLYRFDVDGEERELIITEDKVRFGFMTSADFLNVTDPRESRVLERIQVDLEEPTGEVFYAISGGRVEQISAEEVAEIEAQASEANVRVFETFSDGEQTLVLVNQEPLSRFEDPSDPSIFIYTTNPDAVSQILVTDENGRPVTLELAAEAVDFGWFTTPDLLDPIAPLDSQIVRRAPLDAVDATGSNLIFEVQEDGSVIERDLAEVEDVIAEVEIESFETYAVEVGGETQELILAYLSTLDTFVDPDNPEIVEYAVARTAEEVEMIDPQFDNYDVVLNDIQLDRALVNTAFVTVAVTLGQLITSVFGGYAFSRIRFPGRDLIFLMYLGSIMIPFVVLVVPLYRLMVEFGWQGRIVSLIVPWVFTAYGTFLMRQFFLTIPKEIEEAALLDGCSRLRILWRIFVPLSTPAIATQIIFTFLYAWNSFLWPLLIIGEGEIDNSVLTLSLINLSNIASDQPNLVMTGAAVAILPPIIVFVLAQRYFIEGVATSGLKG